MRLTLASTLALLLAARTADAAPCITLAATNDLHGTVEAREHGAGDHAARQGGLLALSGYVDILRQRYGSSLLLVDAGDIYQGTLVSNHFEGKPMIEALSALGYHASVLGNHEFDFGPGKSGGTDRLAVLKQRASEAFFPLLGLNVIERSTKKPLAAKNIQPSRLLRVGEVTVGVLGLATVDTAKQTKPENVTTLDFVEPAELVTREAAALRKAGAQLVVLVGHLGSQCHDTHNAEDLSSCDMDGELLALLSRLPKGAVDAAVGGHTHREIAHWVNGVATVEGGAYGRLLSRVDVCVAEGGGIDRQRSTIYEPQQVCLVEWQEGGCGPRKKTRGTRAATYLGTPVKPNAKVEKVLAPYLAEIKRMGDEPIGAVLPRPLKRDSHDESLGTVVVEAMARYAGTAIALTNLGGVRDDLPAGALAFDQVFRVLPFGNKVTVLTLTGAELRGAIEALMGRRGAPPYLWGVRVERRDGATRLVTADGALLSDTASYPVAVTDFLAMGGDGLEGLAKVATDRRRVLEATDRDALIALLKVRFPPRS